MNPIKRNLKTMAITVAMILPALARNAINVDFSLDTSGGNPNPQSDPGGVLATTTGPSPDTGTVWNDFAVPMTGPDNTLPDGFTTGNLVDSLGITTNVGITLKSFLDNSLPDIDRREVWEKARNTTQSNPIQQDWIQPKNTARFVRFVVTGLDPGLAYDFFPIGVVGCRTQFLITDDTGPKSNACYSIANEPDTDLWVSGDQFIKFNGLVPQADGTIFVDVRFLNSGSPPNEFGAISGLQIVPIPAENFTYADSVASDGGSFNNLTSYNPSNLMNDGFTSKFDVIDASVAYPASNNNYATVNPVSFPLNLTFTFDRPTDLNGMFIWNYNFRSGGGNSNTTAGVKDFTLTFYDGPDGTGSQVGDTFSATASQLQPSSSNPSEAFYFGTYAGIRSVAMRVTSNYGASFVGMCEVGFNGAAKPYQAFLESNLNETQLSDPEFTAPLADGDRDGIDNYLEYAFLLDPTRAQDIQPYRFTTVNVPDVGIFPAISFRQRTDIDAPVYTVEISSDLVRWTSNEVGPPVTETVGAPIDNGDGTVTTTVRALNPGQSVFFRVDVSDL